MTIRFLADEDLDADITEGLRSREPAIDIVDAKKIGLRGSNDPVLREVIESLLLVWTASEASEWRDSIVYLPFR